jgi:uncharacterized DUF497 family protein
VRISSFGWDQDNIAKVEAHDLSPDDVESLFVDGEPLFRPHSRIPGRVIALGFVPDGRLVLVAFTYNKRRRVVRVVTAYEPTEPEWRIRYEANKK